LIKENILTTDTYLAYCAKTFGLTIFDLKNFDSTLLTQSILKPEHIYHYRILPLRRDENNLYIGMTDPTDTASLTAIGFYTGLHIHPLLVSPVELEQLLRIYCAPKMLHSQLESALAKITPIENMVTTSDAALDADKEPITQFVDNLIQAAITKNVTDIHIEPYEFHCRIRFRRDGLLYEVATVPTHFAIRMMARLKIIANLDIAERRLPQDGRITIQDKIKTDIRINTCPTLFGEKIVLRLLKTNNIDLEISSLGFTTIQENLFQQILLKPQGLILVTGPTGSGKTLTLYSALSHLNQIEKNICTAEDPIEIELPGINQVNINPKIGLNFSTILRSFLRQDPDVMMIGEIRDKDTATMALQAAQTGHLILSTLHTNSAIEAIIRLQSMEIPLYQIMHSAILIMAQRLVRKLCNYCKTLQKIPAHLQHLTSNLSSFQPTGCKQCHQGYEGRIGIFELIPVTENIRTSLFNTDNADYFLQKIKKEHSTLWVSGLDKVHKGITSLEELIRVVGIET